MKELLIVEPRRSLAETMARLIRLDIPDVTPTLSTSAREANLLFKNGAGPFSVAILEVGPGSFTAEQRDLYSALSNDFVLVIHCSAYLSDPIVQAELTNIRGRLSLDRVDRTSVEWPQQLVRRVRAHLAGQQIVEDIEHLFKAAARPGAIGQPSATSVLSRIRRDIASHWADMADPRLRSRINGSYLMVEQAPGAGLAIHLI